MDHPRPEGCSVAICLQDTDALQQAVGFSRQRAIGMLQHPAASHEHHAGDACGESAALWLPVAANTRPCRASKQWDAHDQRVDATATWMVFETLGMAEKAHSG